IAGNLRKHTSPALLNVIVVLLVGANVINIGADLGAMAAALKLMIGGPSLLYVAALALFSALLEIYARYSRYVSVLKCLTLSLFAYVATLFIVDMPWGEVFKALVAPSFDLTKDYVTSVVAVMGT